MPSIGHVAVGLAGGRALARGEAKVWPAMLALSLLSVAPDLDTLSFVLGVPYDAPWGHRGATHSLLVGLVLGGLVVLLAKPLHWPLRRTALIALAVGVSHGLLDTLTFGGGFGCALWWPFSDARVWAPFRFIPIAPIGPYMFSERGGGVVSVELLLFSPFWLYALWPRRRPGAAVRP